MNVRQCKRCNKIFQYTGNPVCNECVKELDIKFTQVRDFLYDNPSANMDAICEATGAESSDIRRWLSEGRLLLNNNSAALLKCEKCGKPIQTGRLCGECSDLMRSQFKGASDAMRPPAPEPFETKSTGKMHVNIRKK